MTHGDDPPVDHHRVDASPPEELTIPGLLQAAPTAPDRPKGAATVSVVAGPAHADARYGPGGQGMKSPGAATWATLCWEPGPRADELSPGGAG
jgi:hypothetical protein